MAVDFTTPVLIIGGGPVGFATALDLAWRGIPSMVAERDAGTAQVMLAKANGLDERTMEHFRRWGLHERLTAVSFPQDYPGDTVYCTSLTGDLLGRSVVPSINEEISPRGAGEKRNTCPQYELDKLLARAVVERGLTNVRYNATFGKLKQDADGVTTELLDSGTGEPFTVRSKFLIACDGAGSAVRRALDIPFEGPQLDFSLSVMVRVPEMRLPPLLARGQRYMCIDATGTWCIFTFMDGRQIWRLTTVGAQDKLDADTYDVEADIRRALGTDDIEFEVIRRIPWRRSQSVAREYRMGRVLLAGDSAHTMSPTGGHGLNTGLGDVSDLTWMLEAELNGWAGPKLLDAYGLERRPIAIRNGAKSTESYKGWVDNSGYAQVLDQTPEGEAARKRIGDNLVESLRAEWFSHGTALGFRYEGSPIIVPDGTPAPADDPSEYVATARPGHRAPHVALADGRSILSLFGHGFVLLRLGAEGIDISQLDQAAKAVGMPFATIDLDEPEVIETYERKLVLVRPDGHVAWRGDAPPDDSRKLIDTVRGVA